MSDRPYVISNDKREQIWNAADELEAAGKPVTMKSIKEHMGGGSFTYISPVLRDWKEARKPKFTISGEFPEELRLVIEEAVTHIAGRFNEAFAGLANNRIEQATGDMDARLRSANEQITEMETEYAILETQRDEKNGLIQVLSEKSDDQLNEITILNDRVIELSSSLKSNEQELNGTNNLVRDLERDLKSSDEKSQALQEKLTAKDRLIDALTRKLENMEQELSDSVKLSVSQQTMLERTQAQLEEKEKKYEIAIEKATGKIEALETTIKDLNNKSVSMKTKVSALEARIDDRNIQIGKLEKEKESTREKLESNIEKIRDLEDRHETAQKRIRELSAETGTLKRTIAAMEKETGKTTETKAKK